VPGSPALAWTGARTTPDQVADFFNTMWNHFQTAESRAAVETIVVDGDDAVVFGSFDHVAKSTGKPFHTPFAMQVRVSGGRITRLHLYEDTLAVAQAFDAA
jgi:ketosteroid isomerase-like protein